MRPHVRIVVGLVIVPGILMTLILGLHLGGTNLLQFGVYFPLLGAFIGGCLTLISINVPIKSTENTEPWTKHEKLSWVFIGCSCIAWGVGECFWRYYIAHGQNPFPSLADVGYSSFFILAFAGLILQNFPQTNTNKRGFLLLDSLIATGALLSIAWFLLLGSLAQSPEQSSLDKIIAIYYPIADTTLLSYTIFLLLRERSHQHHVIARQMSLLLIAVGLTVYTTSDFFFNLLQNMGLPVDATWIDLGWPLGMMIIGVAAYMRRFLPWTPIINPQDNQNTNYYQQSTLNLAQTLPYLLLLLLFIVLTINVLSDTPLQESIRPVLILATFIVVILVVIRQIITALDNMRLMKEQAATLMQLEQVYQDIEQRQFELETGISHLKEIQTRLANGDVRARAQILSGDLWPLASGLNIMADRMMRSDQRQRYAQNLLKAISDLNIALEHRDNRIPFVLPASCLNAPLELNHLLQIIGLKPGQRSLPTPRVSTPPPLSTLARSNSSPLASDLYTPRRKQTQPHRVSLLARDDTENILSDR